MKEALLKALGEGFRLDATGFDIPRAIRYGEPSGELELPQAPGVSWYLEDLSDERFAAAFAQDVGSRARQ